MSALTLNRVEARLGELHILRGVDLEVPFGEVHALMGPNGSGKSTLCHVLAGKAGYQVSGSARLDGEELLEMAVDERARAGLFETFQYPLEIPGVTLADLVTEMAPGAPAGFENRAQRLATEMEMEPFMDRAVNVGLSGGEKKRSEVFQLLAMEPKAAVLDEIDSGLDVDAVREVASALDKLRHPTRAVLLITHYSRILRHVDVDRIHIMVAGRIVESGGPEVAARLEAEGYDALRQAYGDAPPSPADPFADL
ncbi:MAG: Fe-S cluster assembly ATPase SufC [Acidimicrobiia bacterium]